MHVYKIIPYSPSCKKKSSTAEVMSEFSAEKRLHWHTVVLLPYIRSILDIFGLTIHETINDFVRK